MEGKKEQSEKEKNSQITNKIIAKIMIEELKLKYPNFNNIDIIKSREISQNIFPK